MPTRTDDGAVDSYVCKRREYIGSFFRTRNWRARDFMVCGKVHALLVTPVAAKHAIECPVNDGCTPKL